MKGSTFIVNKFLDDKDKAMKELSEVERADKEFFGIQLKRRISHVKANNQMQFKLRRTDAGTTGVCDQQSKAVYHLDKS